MAGSVVLWLPELLVSLRQQLFERQINHSRARKSPEHVAETIVRAGERRKGEVVFTLMGKIGVRLLPLSYHLAEWGRRLALPIMRKVLGGRNEK